MPGLTLAGLLKVEGGKGGNILQAKRRHQRSQSWRRRETRATVASSTTAPTLASRHSGAGALAAGAAVLEQGGKAWEPAAPERSGNACPAASRSHVRRQVPAPRRRRRAPQLPCRPDSQWQGGSEVESVICSSRMG